MGAYEKAEQEKSSITKELFVNTNNTLCVLDLFLKGQDIRNKFNVSRESERFVILRHKELLEVCDSGKILFFRKYEYNKILNSYLEKKYNITYQMTDIFPDENQQNEIKKRNTEKEILSEISNLKWDKINKVSSVIYNAVDSKGRKLTLRYSPGKSNKGKLNKLIYDDSEISYAEYDVKNIVTLIEQTHPTIKKDDRIIIVTNYANSKQNKSDKKKQKKHKKIKNKGVYDIQSYSELERIGENFKLDNEHVTYIVGKIQRRCSYCQDFRCSRSRKLCKPYYKDCIFYNSFMQMVLDKSKKMNEINKPKQVSKIPQQAPVSNKKKKDTVKENKSPILEIGVKDFVVRGNTFKCTHNKHTIDNVDAKITIVSDSGKKQQIKITAGYCRQCKVYFIMESTYQKLKYMGFILCRVTDEKVYHKGGFVNGTKLAQESILMQYGYNVSQTSGLSATRRQKILAVIIDNKVLSKSEIISYLDFFIRQRSNRSNMAIAISRWEDDREFVENYKIGHYTQFGVNAIYRR